MKIEWTEELATGIVWQDKQHKELIVRANRLIDAVGGGNGKEELVKLLDFLDEYVVVHFHEEEQVMNKHNYPETIDHIEEHTEFIENLALLRERSLDEEDIAGELHTRLAYWLMNHIATLDKDLAAFLMKKGAVG